MRDGMVRDAHAAVRRNRGGVCLVATGLCGRGGSVAVRGHLPPRRVRRGATRLVQDDVLLRTVNAEAPVDGAVGPHLGAIREVVRRVRVPRLVPTVAHDLVNQLGADELCPVQPVWPGKGQSKIKYR